MLTLFFIWLASIFVWPVVLLSCYGINKHLLSKPTNLVRGFFSNLGWMFVGAGGFGAISGITANSSDNEVIVRFSVALLFITFGFILTIINLGD